MKLAAGILGRRLRYYPMRSIPSDGLSTLIGWGVSMSAKQSDTRKIRYGYMNGWSVWWRKLFLAVILCATGLESRWRGKEVVSGEVVMRHTRAAGPWRQPLFHCGEEWMPVDKSRWIPFQACQLIRRHHLPMPLPSPRWGRLWAWRGVDGFISLRTLYSIVIFRDIHLQGFLDVLYSASDKWWIRAQMKTVQAIRRRLRSHYLPRGW